MNTLRAVTELFRVDNLHAKPVEGDAEILRGLTITVNEARRSAQITWRCTGSSGTLNLSQEAGNLPNATLPRTDTNAHYWADVLNQVIPNLV